MEHFKILFGLLVIIYFIRGFYYYKYLNKKEIVSKNYFKFLTSGEHNYGFYLVFPIVKEKININRNSELYILNIIYFVLWISIITFSIL